MGLRKKIGYVLIILAIGIFIGFFFNKAISSNGNVIAQTNIKTGISLGDKAPDFTLVDIEGNTITRDGLTQDKPVLLYFMATWCPYCKSDYEAIRNVYPEYEDKVSLVAVSIDPTDSSKKLKEYKESNNNPGYFAPLRGSILQDYLVKGTTYKYGISKEGKIIYKKVGAVGKDEWRRIFETLVREGY